MKLMTCPDQRPARDQRIRLRRRMARAMPDPQTVRRPALGRLRVQPQFTAGTSSANGGATPRAASGSSPSVTPPPIGSSARICFRPTLGPCRRGSHPRGAREPPAADARRAHRPPAHGGVQLRRPPLPGLPWRYDQLGPGRQRRADLRAILQIPPAARPAECGRTTTSMPWCRYAPPGAACRTCAPTWCRSSRAGIFARSIPAAGSHPIGLRCSIGSAPVLPVGFYYKAFHSKRWFPRWERMFRHLSGLGCVDLAAPRRTTAKRYDFCDVLVIGAGPSGLAAAVAAAERGRRRGAGR